MTRRRVVALLQSLESSRQRMMYSFCSIFKRTICSTCRALFCRLLLRFPGAAEISPACAQVAHQFCSCPMDVFCSLCPGQHITEQLVLSCLAKSLYSPRLSPVYLLG